MEVVYNFEVARVHTYLVGASGVLVHNKSQRVPKFKKAKRGATQKAGSTDVPSWMKQNRHAAPFEGESAKKFATRMMNSKHGEGNWTRKGQQAREFSRIKKYADRHFE